MAYTGGTPVDLIKQKFRMLTIQKIKGKIDVDSIILK